LIEQFLEKACLQTWAGNEHFRSLGASKSGNKREKTWIANAKSRENRRSALRRPTYYCGEICIDRTCPATNTTHIPPRCVAGQPVILSYHFARKIAPEG
jgi:hypothetical protein